MESKAVFLFFFVVHVVRRNPAHRDAGPWLFPTCPWRAPCKTSFTWLAGGTCTAGGWAKAPGWRCFSSCWCGIWMYFGLLGGRILQVKGSVELFRRYQNYIYQIYWIFLYFKLPVFGVKSSNLWGGQGFWAPEFYPLLWDSLKFHDQMCPDSGVIGLHFQDLPVGTIYNLEDVCMSNICIYLNIHNIYPPETQHIP